MEVGALSFDERVAARAARFGLKRPAEAPAVEDEPRRRIAQLKISDGATAVGGDTARKERPAAEPTTGSRVVQITGSWRPAAAAAPALAAKRPPPPGENESVPAPEQTSRDVKRARDAAAGCARPEATAVPDRAGRAVWLEKVQAIRGRQESDRDSSASADREAVSSWIPLPKRQARQRS